MAWTWQRKRAFGKMGLRGAQGRTWPLAVACLQLVAGLWIDPRAALGQQGAPDSRAGPLPAAATARAALARWQAAQPKGWAAQAASVRRETEWIWSHCNSVAADPDAPQPHVKCAPRTAALLARLQGRPDLAAAVYADSLIWAGASWDGSVPDLVAGRSPSNPPVWDAIAVLLSAVPALASQELTAAWLLAAIEAGVVSKRFAESSLLEAELTAAADGFAGLTHLLMTQHLAWGTARAWLAEAQTWWQQHGHLSAAGWRAAAEQNRERWAQNGTLPQLGWTLAPPWPNALPLGAQARAAALWQLRDLLRTADTTEDLAFALGEQLRHAGCALRCLAVPPPLAGRQLQPWVAPGSAMQGAAALPALPTAAAFAPLPPPAVPKTADLEALRSEYTALRKGCPSIAQRPGVSYAKLRSMEASCVRRQIAILSKARQNKGLATWLIIHGDLALAATEGLAPVGPGWFVDPQDEPPAIDYASGYNVPLLTSELLPYADPVAVADAATAAMYALRDSADATTRATLAALRTVLEATHPDTSICVDHPLDASDRSCVEQWGAFWMKWRGQPLAQVQQAALEIAAANRRSNDWLRRWHGFAVKSADAADPVDASCRTSVRWRATALADPATPEPVAAAFEAEALRRRETFLTFWHCTEPWLAPQGPRP